MTTQNTIRTRAGLLSVLVLSVAAAATITPSSTALICAPVLGGGSAECGVAFDGACRALLGSSHGGVTGGGLEAGGADLCSNLAISCPEGTYWAVEGGFASAGPRDYVLATMECAGETIAACTADLLRNPCTAQGDSIAGEGVCSLYVFDNLDGIAVTGAYAECVDPVDPSRVIPAVLRSPEHLFG